MYSTLLKTDYRQQYCCAKIEPRMANAGEAHQHIFQYFTVANMNSCAGLSIETMLTHDGTDLNLLIISIQTNYRASTSKVVNGPLSKLRKLTPFFYSNVVHGKHV